MLVVRYGEVYGRLEDGSRSGSNWLKEVVNIRDETGNGHDGWFEDCVVRRVGDGENTLF